MRRVCTEPGCPTLVDKGRCPAHQRADQRIQDRERRDDEHRRLLRTERWKRISASWLRQHPLCGELADGTLSQELSECAAQGLTTPAEVTDHIYPVSKGGSHWDQSNYCSLCRRCNSLKGDRIPVGRAPGDDDRGVVLA